MRKALQIGDALEAVKRAKAATNGGTINQAVAAAVARSTPLAPDLGAFKNLPKADQQRLYRIASPELQRKYRTVFTP